ncbi:MAG: YraN family protein [Oceanicaulis sp.]
MSARPSRERRRAERSGRRAETLAALFLTLKGWRVIERRARTGAGEIDLVCLRGDVLAFVEVKARATIEEARWSVSYHQRSRLMRAGSAWRARHPRFARFQPRFDLVLLAPWRWPVHETGVFEAESAAERDLI